MRTWIAVFALVMLWSATALATAQLGDNLVYKGQTYNIHTNPLETYFDEQHPRPDKLFGASCTACWRGYVATWEIKDDGFLYLLRLVEGTCAGNAPEIPLDKVFPGQKGPIKATWFSGMLEAPQGELLHYVHMGYQSVYEKELHIFIEAGKVTREETIDNRPPEDKGFDKIMDLKGKQDGEKEKDEGKEKDMDGDGKGEGEKKAPRKPRVPVAR